ncbi:heterokaryon incompatibility, partial [Plenodomus tracheiphilus IPT5]
PLRAKLSCTSLASTPKPVYEALSYTWGDAKDRHPVDLDGVHCSVTVHLAVALQHLRYKTHSRYLWVDALCIHQGDIIERREQVAIIRDIYEASVNVLRWLGEARDDSHLAMDIIKRVDAKKISNRTTYASAFENLCSRPYWTRTWILQEVAV